MPCSTSPRPSASAQSSACSTRTMRTTSSVRDRFWTYVAKEERATLGSFPLLWLIKDAGTRPPVATS
eukprot:11759832-Alexandrium_andersonii.AAC.1